MARSLSVDLRRRVVGAIEGGLSCRRRLSVWRECVERDPVAGSGTARGRSQAQAPGRRPPFATDRGACRTDPFGRGRQEQHYTGGTAGAAEGAWRRRRHRHALAVLQAAQDHAQKNTAHAAEQRRNAVNAAHEAWFEGQLDLDPTRIVFIDETAANTKMARLYGRAPRGERCRAPSPWPLENHHLHRRASPRRDRCADGP